MSKKSTRSGGGRSEQTFSSWQPLNSVPKKFEHPLGQYPHCESMVVSGDVDLVGTYPILGRVRLGYVTRRKLVGGPETITSRNGVGTSCVILLFSYQICTKKWCARHIGGAGIILYTVRAISALVPRLISGDVLVYNIIILSIKYHKLQCDIKKTLVIFISPTFLYYWNQINSSDVKRTLPVHLLSPSHTRTTKSKFSFTVVWIVSC